MEEVEAMVAVRGVATVVDKAEEEDNLELPTPSEEVYGSSSEKVFLCTTRKEQRTN